MKKKEKRRIAFGMRNGISWIQIHILAKNCQASFLEIHFPSP